jgi:hypothetical protein
MRSAPSTTGHKEKFPDAERGGDDRGDDDRGGVFAPKRRQTRSIRAGEIGLAAVNPGLEAPRLSYVSR